MTKILAPLGDLRAFGSSGLWLAAPMAILQAVNAVRALADPAGFAAYMGAPLFAEADAAWVHVYALRTAFVALLVAALGLRRDIAALKWAALAALVMPAGDAWIAANAGAEASTIIRHVAIGVYVAIACIVFWVADRGRAA